MESAVTEVRTYEGRGLPPVNLPEEAPFQWSKLILHTALANTDPDIDRNIEYAFGLPHKRFNEYLSKEKGTVSIVGSGPSLKANWQHIKGDIIACNAAGQFLLERGVVPKYWMCFDADPLVESILTPHPDITYLLASRCHKIAYDILKDCNVVVWHAAGDTNISTLLDKHKRMEPMVAGGSAAVTRTMFLAVALGYKKLHMYGSDSAFQATDTHFRESTTVEKRMLIMCNDRVFWTAPWMAQQGEDFKALAPQLESLGVDITVHGDGLIPHLALSMGFKTDLESNAKRIAKQWKWKAKTLWRNL